MYLVYPSNFGEYLGGLYLLAVGYAAMSMRKKMICLSLYFPLFWVCI